MIAEIVQFLVAGLTLGAIYALIAFSLSLVYRTTRILNIAQGEFSMLGAMMAIAFVSATVPMPLAIVIAVVFAIIVGFLMERLTIRRAMRFPQMTIVMVTVGVSMTFQGLALVLWGSDSFSLPHLSGSTPINIVGAAILPQTLWILGVSLVLSLVFWAFFDKTMIGLAMRANAENILSASLVGINPKKITSLTFMFAAAVGAVAGILLAPIVFMNFLAGMMLVIKGSVAAILGGINSNVGAIIGGLTLGLVESISAGIFPSLYKDVIAFFILLVVLCALPKGIIRESA